MAKKATKMMMKEQEWGSKSKLAKMNIIEIIWLKSENKMEMYQEMSRA